MQERIASLRQLQQTLLVSATESLYHYLEIESELQRIETLDQRDLPPPTASIVFALLVRLFAELALVWNRKQAGLRVPLESVSPPAQKATINTCFNNCGHEASTTMVLPNEEAPTSEARCPDEDSAPPGKSPEQTIGLDIDRYITINEDGRAIAGKRISRSRWIIFGLLLEANGDRVPFSTLIRHVPVWAAMLENGNTPDEGAIKRMLSKINTLDLRGLGLPYVVKTKKDRKSGIVSAFMVAA